MAYQTGILWVNLLAIADNWLKLKKSVGSSVDCGAVVKASAYGLGVERVAPKLYHVGCRHFFVANFKEGVQLQSLVGLDTAIYVLSGCIAGTEKEFVSRGLIPVIVSREMLERWLLIKGEESDDAVFLDSLSEARCILKVDTGMGRLGLAEADFNYYLENASLLKEAGVDILMSHLACADEPAHPLNAIQIERFGKMLSDLQAKLPNIKGSLANSAGMTQLVGAAFDLVRPGIGLYGDSSVTGQCRVMPVVELSLPIIQLRDLPVGQSVGYGATVKFDQERKLAVVAGGYADGIFRSLGNHGFGWLRGCLVPIVGRISMDSTVFDITNVPTVDEVAVGEGIELLGAHVSVAGLAEAAGTVSYEVLTALGERYQRCYLG